VKLHKQKNFLMSLKKNSSDKSNVVIPKKSYHFFSLPMTFILEGEINKIIDGVSKKLFFTLFEEDFLYYEVNINFCLKISQIFRIKQKKISKVEFISTLI